MSAIGNERESEGAGEGGGERTNETQAVPRGACVGEIAVVPPVLVGGPGLGADLLVHFLVLGLHDRRLAIAVTVVFR